MKKTRFTEERMVTILRKADAMPVPELARSTASAHIICRCHQVVRIRQIMWRHGNAPQQFGKDLGPILFLQGVELVEDLLGGLRHEIRVPSSSSPGESLN